MVRAALAWREGPTGYSRSWNRAGAPLQEAQTWNQLEPRGGILTCPNEDKVINGFNVSAIKLYNDDHSQRKMNLNDLESKSIYVKMFPPLQVQIHLSVRLPWPRWFPNRTPVFSDLCSGTSFNKFTARFTKQYSVLMINLNLHCTMMTGLTFTVTQAPVETRFHLN